MSTPSCQPCQPPCDQLVFDRAVVSYLIRGMTKISWTLVDTFTDQNPLEFQLQVGQTANPDADDWTDVGLPVVDQFVAYDPDQHVWGKDNWTHYRIVLTTSRGTYYSPPIGGMGTLDRRAWRLAREIIRQRIVAFRFGPGGQEGYLLKRRRTGTPCVKCLDPATKTVLNPDCPDCYGTGFECGYFYPAGCVWAEMSPKTYHLDMDVEQRGAIEDVAVRALMVMTELLSEEDIWVGKKTDNRYYVHSIQHTSEMRGVPLLAEVELRPVPFSSVIYGISIPDQISSVVEE